MTTYELQQEIIRLKKEKNICILVHAYQSHDIWEVADFIGDSYALAKKAAEVKNKTVVMCGVRFMAESVKILSPETETILPVATATCPMAEQIAPERVRKFKEEKEQLNPVQKIIKINTIIETIIAPELRKDFGDIELVNVEGNNVFVKLKGHCSTCANAKLTLKNFVETKLKELVDDEIIVKED